jgi:hypothetical protein
MYLVNSGLIKKWPFGNSNFDLGATMWCNNTHQWCFASLDDPTNRCFQSFASNSIKKLDSNHQEKSKIKTLIHN